MENQKSALGLDGNITALIGYLIWIVALILIFIEKDNKFVRFHAFQATLWGAACFVGIIIVAIVGTIVTLILGQASGALAGLSGILFTLLYLALFLALLGGMIYGAIKAYGGNMFKLPIVGNIAENMANK
jgi:uncharacterized membrane protein